MRIAACILYTVFLFLYFLLDLGSWWGTIYITVQALMIAYVIHEQSKTHTYVERQFFDYIKYVALADAAYTVVAKINGGDFVYHNNNVFAYILLIGVAVMTLHFAVNKDKF